MKQSADEHVLVEDKRSLTTVDKQVALIYHTTRFNRNILQIMKKDKTHLIY